MRLLITRPAERANPLKERLQELGFDISLAPLLTISFLDFSVPETPLQGVIFTSVQGVEASKTKESLKIFPAFAVGSKTAGAASSGGFQIVHNADGTVEDLFELVLKVCNPGKGLLLHLAGEITVGNLAQRLREKGFETKFQAVYKATAAESLPANVVEKIQKHQIDGVVFFSTRTAAIFSELVQKKELTEKINKMEAFCLSEAIAEETRALGWKKVHVSQDPNEASMVELLQGIRK